MKKAILTAGIVAIVVTMAGADALARGGRRGRMRAGGQGFGQGMGPCAGAALDLSADQQQRLVKLRAGHRVQIAPVQAELGVKRAELNALWVADELDSDAVQAKSAEVEKLRSRLNDARVKHRLAVAAILTPAQRQQMARLRGNGPRGHGGHGMMMCNRRGGRGKGAGFGIGHRRGQGRGMGAGFGKGGGQGRDGAGWGQGPGWGHGGW